MWSALFLAMEVSCCWGDLWSRALLQHLLALLAAWSHFPAWKTNECIPLLGQSLWKVLYLEVNRGSQAYE